MNYSEMFFIDVCVILLTKSIFAVFIFQYSVWELHQIDLVYFMHNTFLFL